MPGQAGQSDDTLRRLAAWAARWRVVEKDLSREIYHAAHDIGVSQRQISEVVGSLSQATVQRILRRITDDPALFDEKPPAETPEIPETPNRSLRCDACRQAC